MNGGGKLAMWLIGLLATITLGWTASQSANDADQNEHITAAEENIRTIHYEAQIQRNLMKRIAVKVGAEVSDVPDVRPLREAK